MNFGLISVRKGMEPMSRFMKRQFFSTESWNGVVKNVTIIGAGQMGSGIAHAAASAGCNVFVVDSSEKSLRNGEKTIQKSMERIVKKKYPDDVEAGKEAIGNVLSKIIWSVDLNSSVKNSDLVIEAIVEDMNIKKKLWSQLDSISAPHTIFASNTSSLSIQEMAEVTKRKDKFAGIHFFNPVAVMQLVEVVKTPSTSAETHNTLIQFAKRLGKTPVSCKDTPGFIVNRLLVPYCAEAIRLYERGDASKEDIDIAMKKGAGYPMGPFALSDYVGLDTMKFILDGWHKKYPDVELFSPIGLLNDLVKEGKLGCKSGEGFFKYDK